MQYDNILSKNESMIKVGDNIFYDSLDRVYRYRMHCEICGRVSGCRCFESLEEAEDFSISGMDTMCSGKCYVVYMLNEDHELVEDTMKEMGTISLSDSLKSGYIPRFMKPCHVTILRIINFFTIWRFKWYFLKYFNKISYDDAIKVIDEMDIDYDNMQGDSC